MSKGSRGHSSHHELSPAEIVSEAHQSQSSFSPLDTTLIMKTNKQNKKGNQAFSFCLPGERRCPLLVSLLFMKFVGLNIPSIILQSHGRITVGNEKCVKART